MADQERAYFCSTPIKTSPLQQTFNRSNHSAGEQAERIHELQSSLSEIALENEMLKFELQTLKQRCHELSVENQQLHQTVQDQRDIQTRMKKQLNTVTQTVYVIYERFKSLKSRYYEEQYAGGSEPSCP